MVIFHDFPSFSDVFCQRLPEASILDPSRPGFFYIPSETLGITIGSPSEGSWDSGFSPESQQPKKTEQTEGIWPVKNGGPLVHDDV